MLVPDSSPSKENSSPHGRLARKSASKILMDVDDVRVLRDSASMRSPTDRADCVSTVPPSSPRIQPLFQAPPTPTRSSTSSRPQPSSSKKRPAPPPTPTKATGVIELDDSDSGEYFGYDEPISLGDDDEIQITGGASGSGAHANSGTGKGKGKGKGRAPAGTVTYGQAFDPAGEFADLPASAFDLDMSDDVVPLAGPPTAGSSRRRGLPSSPPPAYHEIATVGRPSRSSTAGRSSGATAGALGSSGGTGGGGGTGLTHPWSRECLSVLSKTFRLRSFRPNQVEAINGTLGGRDVFVLMPTGGGKSLCYQLPSQVHGGATSGVTIIVSPLISLINDQVEHLRQLGVAAIPFTGDLPAQDKKRAMAFLGGGPAGRDSVDGAVVYVTPEMLGKSPTFQGLLRGIHHRGKLARFVIDEAHCLSSVRSLPRALVLRRARTHARSCADLVRLPPLIPLLLVGPRRECSERMHPSPRRALADARRARPPASQFRPDYRDLANLKDDYPGTPIMALTATANLQVRDDIVRSLRIGDCVTITSSFNRTNLHYEIRPKSKKVTDDIAAFIRGGFGGDCGIIYASSRDGCEKVAKDLRDKHRINAAHYHAGMTKDDRAWTQSAWQSGEIKVIVATVSPRPRPLPFAPPLGP